MEDAKIKIRIIHSKAGVSTTDKTTVRTLIHFLPRSVARQRLMQLHLNDQIRTFALLFVTLEIFDLCEFQNTQDAQLDSLFLVFKI